MRISLGTAQFGLDYGVTNASGQVSLSAAKTILSTAQTNGVYEIDTAAAYGAAETVLQDCSDLLGEFEITTKVPSLVHLRGKAAIDALKTHVTTSYERLGRQLKTVLLHDVNDIFRPNGLALWAALEETASAFGIKKIGVSMYDGAEIERTLKLVTPSVVQLPINVFDQRLAGDGSLERLASKGCAIEARSAFLQGLVLASPQQIPYYLQGLVPAATRLHQEAQEAGTTPLNIALGYLRLSGCIDRAVVGVTSASELEAICNVKNAAIPSVSYPNFRVCEASLVDPRQWSALKQEKRAS